MSEAHEWSVMLISSTSMRLIDIDPIHVVAAMETATTTAIRIIDAITGLSALLFWVRLANQDTHVHS